MFVRHLRGIGPFGPPPPPAARVLVARVVVNFSAPSATSGARFYFRRIYDDLRMETRNV